MADPVIPKETLKAGAAGVCEALDPTGDICEEACSGCERDARAAILAYHADLARRGLKVVARRPSPTMASTVGLAGASSPKVLNYADAFEIMWNAAESVL